MYKEIQLSLYHDGQTWGVYGLNTQIYDKELGNLEKKIINEVTDNSRNDTVKVTLLFDMDSLPRWLHQYQAHYFNYSFTVTGQGTTDTI